MEEREQIIKYALENLFVKGYQYVTMDNIATGLKISKKTIYKYFNSKDELFEGVVLLMLSTIKTQIEQIVSQNATSVEKFIKIIKVVLSVLAKMNADTMEFLKIKGYKYWEKIEEFRKGMIINNYSILIEQGKQEGLFEDHSTILMIAFVQAAAKEIINPNFILNNNLTFTTAVEETIDILMYGFLTHKGLKLYKKLKKEL